MSWRSRAALYGLPLLVLALAAGVSWWQWNRERADIEAQLQAEFDSRFRETVGLFRERMLAYEQSLHATHGLFASKADVQRGDFQAFVGSMRIQTHPGLLGLGYSVRVMPSELAAHERKVRTQGYPDYAVRPAGPRAEYTSALYFEPTALTALSTLGSDFHAEPSRRHAMDAARDSGTIAISNKIKLPDEDAQQVQPGYRMFMPVYGGGPVPATVEDRRKALTGWIYAAFSMDGLMANILGERTNMVVEVYDGGVGEGDDVEAVSDRVGGESSVKLLTASQKVQVGGYSWTLTAQALPNFATPIATSQLQLVARVGAAASLLLAILTWALIRRRIRARMADDELRAAKEHAEAASVAKTRFLAAASHDLRQPVQALGLFAATLQAMARKPQLSGEEVGHVAGRLQLALQGLGRLLNGLFDLSGLDNGTVTVSKRPVAIEQLFAELQTAFAGPAAAKGLQLRVRARRALWLDTDPVIVSRILSNLVANAVRYTNEGAVLVGCRLHGNEVEMQVIDTGIGIAPAEQARIFSEFYQVADVSRERERGMGLGLAIAQRSAQLLGGSIRVRSAPGKGSCFSLTLPCHEAPGAAMATAGSKDAGLRVKPAMTGLVLVIDDDPQLTEAMRRLLREWGHEAITADGLDAAVEAAASARIGLVITDYQLGPRTTGVDAIDAIRKRIGREVPAIVVTGDTGTRAADHARSKGIPLLLKPVDANALLALVDAAAQADLARSASAASLPA
ncbi:MAG TPA: CHASE domain-containing protein [Ramlibacter sp.]|nr:CHASE domain-containing protein [Ramlibacter sp.]